MRNIIEDFFKLKTLNTNSIATGIAMGFISYAALKLFTGRGREVSWLVYLLAALFILRFVYLKAM